MIGSISPTNFGTEYWRGVSWHLSLSFLIFLSGLTAGRGERRYPTSLSGPRVKCSWYGHLLKHMSMDMTFLSTVQTEAMHTCHAYKSMTLHRLSKKPVPDLKNRDGVFRVLQILGFWTSFSLVGGSPTVRPFWITIGLQQECRPGRFLSGTNKEPQVCLTSFFASRSRIPKHPKLPLVGDDDGNFTLVLRRLHQSYAQVCFKQTRNHAKSHDF